MLTEEFKLSTPNKVNFLKIESQDILLICQPVYKTTSQNILYLTSYCYLPDENKWLRDQNLFAKLSQPKPPNINICHFPSSSFNATLIENIDYNPSWKCSLHRPTERWSTLLLAQQWVEYHASDWLLLFSSERHGPANSRMKMQDKQNYLMMS